MRRVRPMMDGLERRLVMSADPVVPVPIAYQISSTPEATPTPYVATADDPGAVEPISTPVGADGIPLMQTTGAVVSPRAVAAIAPNGTFANNFQKFTYSTRQGTRVELSIKGRGSLEGTFVDSNGALNLRYSKSNAFTKIVSNVHGGNGRAPLATVFSRDQAESGADTSLSGIGSPLIGMINLRQFDLIPGGTVNVTAGIGTLGLRSAGPNSQIQLRELPETTTTNTTTGTSTTGSVTAGTSGNLTTNNIQNNVVSDVFLVQSLAGSDGEFLSAGNFLLQSVPGNPGPPPAPPGVVVAIDHINGDLPVVPNLLSDVRIFGYDPVEGDVIRFQVNLEAGTGAVDPAFAPISVTGSPAGVGVALGHVGQRVVLLVDTGTTVSVYDATYGTGLGAFTVPAGFNDIGSTDVFTVVADTTLNQLQLIDVAASLAAGTAVAPPGNPAPFTPAGGVSLLGGITGLPASNQVYTSIAATFNTLQPLENQLGFLNVSTTTTTTNPEGGLMLVNQFSTVQQQAFAPGGAFVPIPAGNPDQTAVAVGSIDRSLAVNTVGTNSGGAAVPNTVKLMGQVTFTNRGSVVLAYPNQLTDLSESFRPDLTGSVLIDVQGNIQSVRGTDANGLILNNAGNLNLVTFHKMSNSTIVGEPISHVRIQKRDNVSILSTTRTVGGRGGVTYVPNLQQIGPLSQTHNRPQV